MNKIRIYSALLILVFSLVVIVQNFEIINLRILFYTTYMPKATLLGITLLVGIIVGILFSSVLGRRK